MNILLFRVRPAVDGTVLSPFGSHVQTSWRYKQESSCQGIRPSWLTQWASHRWDHSLEHTKTAVNRISESTADPADLRNLRLNSTCRVLSGVTLESSWLVASSWVYLPCFVAKWGQGIPSPCKRRRSRPQSTSAGSTEILKERPLTLLFLKRFCLMKIIRDCIPSLHLLKSLRHRAVHICLLCSGLLIMLRIFNKD